ncbi:MAG: TonB-dependent receptor [Chitinophagales bacterium]|nr:TonB-dependent receptor [Chitinophagales bacterium]
MEKLYLSISFMLLCCFAYAQDEAVDSTQKTIKLNEVVIGTNRFPESRQNAAQQTQTITAQDIKAMNAQSTADVLQQSGVMVQKSQQGGGSPMLRGFEASRVLLVVDGVRMNNIIYRAGHLQNVITVDNSVLEGIDVIFGPGSVVFGSDALGGVVHLRTKRPTLAFDKKFVPKGNAFFRYGTVNSELTGHIDLNLGGKRFASLTSATFSQFGDLRQGMSFAPYGNDSLWNRYNYVQRVNGKDSVFTNGDPSIQKFSGFYQYDLLQKFLFQQNENIAHLLNVQFSNSSNIPRYDRLTDRSGSKFANAEWYYGPQQRLLVAYELKWAKMAGIFDDFAFGVNYQRIVESRNSRGFGKTFLTNRTEKVDVIGFHADFNKKIKTHRINFGADGQFNLLKSTAKATDVNVDTTRAASTRYPDGKNNMNYVGLFLQHQWTITPKIILSDGIRYNYVGLKSSFESQQFYQFPFASTTQNHHAACGNLGFTFLPTKGLKIAALVSTGFRAPNVDDLAKIFETDATAGTVIVPNEKLKPEYTVNTELTLGYTFNQYFRVEATGFYTRFFNAIVTDKFTYNGADTIVLDGKTGTVYANQNKRKADIFGVSARFTADATRWLSLYASVDYTKGRILTDSVPYPLDHVAPVYGRAGVNVHLKQFRLDVFTVFSGKKDIKDYNLEGEDNEQYATAKGMPAWWTLNAHFSVLPCKYFGVDVGIDNILDKKYRVFASGISGAGRNLFVTVRAMF